MASERAILMGSSRELLSRGLAANEPLPLVGRLAAQKHVRA